MPASDHVERRAEIVAILRAAGCVFAETEADLLVSAAQTRADLIRMVDQRAAGVPLEHVLGWAEFCGLRIAVEPGVFVPRRRTQLLVTEAAALARPHAIVADLCCGSGAVGAALLAAESSLDLHAVDLDPAAARCARRNLPGTAAVYLGDLYEPLPATLRGRVDIVVANAPYVPTDAIELLPPEAREHEPAVALDGGPDGLAVLQRVIADAPGWLTPGGHVLVETSERQAPHMIDAAVRAGLVGRAARSPDLDATVVSATKP